MRPMFKRKSLPTINSTKSHGSSLRNNWKKHIYIYTYVYIYIHMYIYIYIFWKPNDPCFYWKRHCFVGLTTPKIVVIWAVFFVLPIFNKDTEAWWFGICISYHRLKEYGVIWGIYWSNFTKGWWCPIELPWIEQRKQNYWLVNRDS